MGDAGGGLHARRREPTATSGDPAADVAAMAKTLRALVAEAGHALADVAAVGVSLPGPTDPERGRVLDPPNLPGWHDVPVRDLLAAELDGIPVRLENDANAAALAEWRFGAGRGARDLVYLTMSTGVGGGIVSGGRLVRGHGGAAGEVGHVQLEWEGETCGCGLRGCFEAYCGGRSWARRLREIAPLGGRVAVLAGGREHVTPVHLVEAAREGDAFARSEMARWNHYLGRAVAMLAFTLNPEVVVLGTIATAAGEELCFEPVRAQVRAHVWPQFAAALRIVPVALGEDLPYYAGLCAALEALSGAA